MGNYKFIISGIIFAAFISIVSFETGYKKGSQEDLSYAAEKALSSVVNIFISNRGINRARNAVGSGVIFSKEGHIVTNTHILTNASSVFVEFNDGEIAEAILIGADKYSDIAVLKITGFEDLNPIDSAESSNIRVGDEVLAIGNPFGVGKTVTSGIISATGRDYGNPYLELLQTDAAINPGNSGGPLLNMRGNIVGINTAIQSTTGEFTGVGFAVPSQTVAKIVPTLISEGEYKHPWIGISGRDIDPDTANVLGLNDALGFLVITVVENSPASDAGMIGTDKTIEVDGREYAVGGDIIVAVDGMDVRKIDDILIHLQRVKTVGDEMNLEILRDGKTTNVTIILQERPN